MLIGKSLMNDKRLFSDWEENVKASIPAGNQNKKCQIFF